MVNLSLLPHAMLIKLCRAFVSLHLHVAQLKYISRALQTGTGSGKKSDESCTELVPYNAEKAAKIAAGINSDSEGSRTVYDILSDSEDSCGSCSYFLITHIHSHSHRRYHHFK